MHKNFIILIDDDEDFRKLIKSILEDHNYLVIEVDSGKKALEILKSTQFDLAIIDIVMPGMDGVELVKKIINLYPSLQIVGTTGGVNILDKDNLHPPSFTLFHGFLFKPFSSLQLLNTVKRLIE